jgi:hypothetical protein
MSDRNLNGTFNDGAGAGASQSEQLRAGGNQWDTRETMAAKVIAQRGIDQGVHRTDWNLLGKIIRWSINCAAALFTMWLASTVGVAATSGGNVKATLILVFGLGALIAANVGFNRLTRPDHADDAKKS